MGLWGAIRKRIGADLYGRTTLADQIRAAAHAEFVTRSSPGLYGWQPSGLPTQPEPLDQDFLAYLKSVGLFAWNTACVDAKANAGASVPLVVRRRDRSGNVADAPDHPLALRIADPNPDHGTYGFMFAALQQLHYTGECFVVGVGPREDAPFVEADEWWVLPSSSMRPILDDAALRLGKSASPVRGWIFRSESAREIRFSPESVVFARVPHPRDPVRGLSPMKKLEATLNLLWRAQAASKKYLDNEMRPSWIVTGTRQPTPGLQQAFERKVKEDHAGVENRGKVLYVWGEDLKVERGSDSPADAQLADIQKWCREEILAVHGCPPYTVGLLEHANYSNANEQQRSFYQHAIIPSMRLLLDAWNTSPLVRGFGDDLVIEADYSGIEALQSNQLERAQRHQTYVRAGILTRNEVRAELGMEPIEGGDALDLGSGGLDRILADFASSETRGVVRRAAKAARILRDAGRAAEGRGLVWKAIDGRRETFVRVWARAVRRLGRDLEDDVMSRLRRRLGVEAEIRAAMKDGASDIPGDVAGSLPDAAAVARDWSDTLAPIARKTMRAGAKDVAGALDADLPLDLDDPRIAAFVTDRMGSKIVTVAENRLDEVRAVIEGAIAERATVAELQTRLREWFGRTSIPWATRIARTETIGLYHQGGLVAMGDLGVERKEWLSSRDAAVRDTHEEADGQVVARDEDFVVGMGRGPAPGLIDAPEESINCRCSILPVVE